MTDFTVRSRVDESRVQAVANGDLPPDGEVVVHDLHDAKGHLIATGMLDADTRIALAARAGADATVLVKGGGLGKKTEATATVGALAKEHRP
jgi:hypothetical protein